ncbi:PhoD-like phosphatase-domain-containing protein [Flagelloscypha sp. PMI_526]|nr:PhoD-like phosphatase-domain-containing protein [Flagelloscypha sp. PMI_526]
MSLTLRMSMPSQLECLRSFNRNLAYSSPFSDNPKLSILGHVEARHTKRQNQENTFDDEKYPTFGGADFSNSPYVWNGGINFTHSGQIVGDPWDKSVILWTRAAPANGASPDVSVPICVAWRISTDPDGDLLDSGEAFTSYDVDWTVKVEASNLSPDSRYVYQFTDCTNRDSSSPVGLTRTLPAPDGWFNAYGIAANNITTDFYVHLGDYIYEYDNTQLDGASIGRNVEGRETATIFDYRQRLGQYRTDPFLVAAHQSGPWITVWDDHEVSDNTWKAGSANSNDSSSGCTFSVSGACFTDRKWAAIRAYHEWMPIRQVDVGDKLRIWRNFQVGKLMDLTMLDTRIYDRDITDVSAVQNIADYANRSMMGSAQEKWFLDTLDDSVSRGAVWRVVGQQVVFTELIYSDNVHANPVNYDQWDGYRANRGRIYDHLYHNKISNVVVLSGDSHANWVSDLSRPNSSYDPASGSGAVGVEFAGTAVTSGSSFGDNIPPEQADQISLGLVSTNKDLQWSEGSYRGFFTLCVNAHWMNASYYALHDPKSPNLDAFISANFSVRANSNRLLRPIAGGHVDAGVLKPDA